MISEKSAAEFRTRSKAFVLFHEGKIYYPAHIVDQLMVGFAKETNPLSVSQDPSKISCEFRGWKFFFPFFCFYCGLQVEPEQWAFSRCCGNCDVGSSPNHRLFGMKCFAGVHVKLASHNVEKGDLPDDCFVDPADRDKYPPLSSPLQRPVPPRPTPRPPRPPRPSRPATPRPFRPGQRPMKPSFRKPSK
jgi:hypothetical protein